MYVEPNFPTKKAFKDAVKQGQTVTVFSPSPFPIERDGIEFIEGPHYPQPHSWYARVEVKDGIVVKVVS
jgi:hypothetical protein